MFLYSKLVSIYKKLDDGVKMVENLFLKMIQESFPLVQRPFKKLGEELGISEEEALSLYAKLKDEKIIRNTSAILETKKVGYKSTLVAFSVDSIEKAAEYINTHPGVSHNYERDHEIFNLWFTLAVPSESSLGLEKTIEILANRTGAKDYIILPTIKMFKIGVVLDTTSTEPLKKDISEKHENKNLELTEFHKKILYYIQRDIPIKYEPFEGIIKELNCDYDSFFNEVNNLIQAGYIRRFATLLNHRKAGFTANAMVVWNVPEEFQELAGETIAKYTSVSHCYIRPKFPPKWNYNLFSMIHGKSKEDLESIIDNISKEIQIKDYLPLYSLREFKKQRIDYFSPKFYEWEKLNSLHSLI
jgi:DNA-binding Lrp family transcriptional regulator